MSKNPNKPPVLNESEPRKERAGHILAKRFLERLTGKTPSIEARIDATRGPFIELGAVPSNPRDGSLIDLRAIKKRLLTSNIYRPQTIETGYRHRLTGEFKIISHRDEAPRSRWFKTTGQDFKVVGTGPNWANPVLDDIDFLADATNLPFDDGSVGALYANALHPEAEPKLIGAEAPRTLEQGGVLVLDGIKEESLLADNPYLDTLVFDRENHNYAAVRNDVPYQPPQLNQ